MRFVCTAALRQAGRRLSTASTPEVARTRASMNMKAALSIAWHPPPGCQANMKANVKANMKAALSIA